MSTLISMTNERKTRTHFIARDGLSVWDPARSLKRKAKVEVFCLTKWWKKIQHKTNGSTEIIFFEIHASATPYENLCHNNLNENERQTPGKNGTPSSAKGNNKIFFDSKTKATQIVKQIENIRISET